MYVFRKINIFLELVFGAFSLANERGVLVTSCTAPTSTKIWRPEGSLCRLSREVLGKNSY
jgi:hypothetical protein